MSPGSKVHVANMGPTWVLSTPDGPHVGPMNIAIMEDLVYNLTTLYFVYIFPHLTDFVIIDRLSPASIGLTGLIANGSKDITKHYKYNDNMFSFYHFIQQIH